MDLKGVTSRLPNPAVLKNGSSVKVVRLDILKEEEGCVCGVRLES